MIKTHALALALLAALSLMPAARAQDALREHARRSLMKSDRQSSRCAPSSH